MSLNVVMVGSGYVGLVSGACFADFGHQVVCVDIDHRRVEQLEGGEVPIFEPGLEELVSRNQKAGRLSFSTNLAGAVSLADVVFIAVGTPSRRGDGHADLSYVYAASRDIARSLTGYTVVVAKSTVPVGTGDEVERIIRETNPEASVSVVSNPEFLREGAAIEDFKKPDRVVVGTNDSRALQVMREAYRPLSLDENALMFTERRTAELIKYAGNAFLAMKISFINEIADLCERTGADVLAVAHGIGLDKRIGGSFLHAGPGYGGSCFPKDTSALLKTGHDHDVHLRLVESTVTANEHRKRSMARRVVAACGGTVRGLKIGVLGLAFKPDTDDLRESPALSVIQGLRDAGARVEVYDPKGMEHLSDHFDDVDHANDPYELAVGTDALVLVTEWDEFRALDLEKLATLMRNPVLIDLRNVYRRSDVESAGLRYESVGRGHESREVSSVAR